MLMFVQITQTIFMKKHVLFGTKKYQNISFMKRFNSKFLCEFKDDKKLDIFDFSELILFDHCKHTLEYTNK